MKIAIPNPERAEHLKEAIQRDSALFRKVFYTICLFAGGRKVRLNFTYIIFLCAVLMLKRIHSFITGKSHKHGEPRVVAIAVPASFLLSQQRLPGCEERSCCQSGSLGML